MRTLHVSKVLVAVMFCLAVTAARSEPHPWTKIDTNADGVVDLEEMRAVHPDLTIDEFNKIDTNSDGQLVSEELTAAFTAKMMKRLDTDGDGAITREEMEGIGAARPDLADQFQQFDADGDGKLDQSEFTEMHEAMRKRFETMRGQSGRPRPRGDTE